MTKTNKYYKRVGESDLGSCMVYLEISDSWPIRQLEIYENTVRWGSVEEPEGLADQPLSELGLVPDDEISAQEFTDAWARHVLTGPGRTRT